MNSSQSQKNSHKPTVKPASLLDYFKTWPLYFLPQHFLSSLIHRFMRIENIAFKNFQIKQFIKLFKVDMSETEIKNIEQFTDFNHFFTRQLKAECRPDTTKKNQLCCPVDGAISELGSIKTDLLMQAKGHHYSLEDLLAEDEQLSETFKDGHFATIYLSPKDYHRIHMPIDGKLQYMFHVPGDLFGVNKASVKTIPQLFARNERVVSVFETEVGPMALIQVGAIFVSSIETIWQGVVTPPRQRYVQQWQYDEQPLFKKSDEMGRFNMGSTVILLFAKDAIKWNPELQANTPVKMGQLLASF